jgi:ketosteroid isomerase-like protein
MRVNQRTLRICGLALVLITFGNSAAGQQADRVVAPVQATITLPPELDRVLRDYERAWRAGDASALAALFTDDGFVLQPGRPPARGRAALEATYAGQGGGSLKLRALAYATSDSIGYIIGAYGYGDDAEDQGKFTLTLRRSPSGRWLIFSDMDNGSRPMRRAPAPPGFR